jgi:hypothetical protein
MTTKSMLGISSSVLLRRFKDGLMPRIYRLETAVRLILSIVVFFILLGISRWTPVHAEALFDLPGRPMAAAAVILAVVCALVSRPCSKSSSRPLAVASGLLLIALGIIVVARGRAGLLCEVRSPRGHVAWLPRGPVNLVPADLGEIKPRPRYTLSWSGALRIPRSGAYRLWLEGQGLAILKLDNVAFLTGDGEPFRVVSDQPLGAGEHQIDIRFYWTALYPRLRLGWSDAPEAHGEAIPARYLGPSKPHALWTLTDLLAAAFALAVAAFLFTVPWNRRRAWPPAEPTTWREILLAALGLAVVVAIMSWPIVLDPAHRGMVHRPDGRLNAWILAWDAHALLHDPGRLFQAPIFHPLPDALTFSENLILPAVLGAPAYFLGGPVLAYNLLLLGGYVACGVGVYLLVRRVSSDRMAAFVGGAVFAVCTYRWMFMAHLHAQFSVFMPFALLALDRFNERRTLRRALAVGALFTLQAYSSVYLGGITAAFLAAAILVGFLGGWRAREGMRLGLALLLAAAALAPLARPYLRMRAFQGVEYDMATVTARATVPISYLASTSRLYSPLTQRHLEDAFEYLFPGLVPLLAGLVGLALAPRRYRAVALAASFLAITISFGPMTPFYRFLHEHVFLVRCLRILGRFAIVPMMCLAVMTGLALSHRKRALVVPVFLFFLVESTFIPLQVARYQGPSRAARWLAQGEGPVAFLPLAAGDTKAMLDSIAHFRPLMNGLSGFVPHPYERATTLLAGQLDHEALRLLRAIGVRHVVTENECDLPLAARFDRVRIYEVTPGEKARVVTPGAPLAGRVTRTGTMIDIGDVRRLDRVVFVLDWSAWISNPLIAHSIDGENWRETRGSVSLADATLSLYRDPQNGCGEIRFAPLRARFLRIDPRLPVRDGRFFLARTDNAGSTRDSPENRSDHDGQ